MTLHVMPDLEQGSPEWHDQRRGMVTASVVGQLLTTRFPGADEYPCPECEADPNQPCRSKVKRAGEYGAIKTFHGQRVDIAASIRDDDQYRVDPANNDTARNLTMFLAAERITGWTEPTYTSDDMWRGVESEPIARDLYSEHFALARQIGFMIREEAGWKLGYSPDGLVGEDGLIEIKAPRSKKQLATILADKVPAEHLPQCQAGLLVSGRKWLDFVSYNGGMPLFVKRVFPDTRWFDAITAAAEQFEEAVAQMVATYNTAIEELPATERVVEMEMSL